MVFASNRKRKIAYVSYKLNYKRKNQSPKNSYDKIAYGFKFIRPSDAIMCVEYIKMNVLLPRIDGFICMTWRKCCAIEAWKQNLLCRWKKKQNSISLLFNVLLFFLLIFNSTWICRTINVFLMQSQRIGRNNIHFEKKSTEINRESIEIDYELVSLRRKLYQSDDSIESSRHTFYSVFFSLS